MACRNSKQTLVIIMFYTETTSGSTCNKRDSHIASCITFLWTKAGNMRFLEGKYHGRVYSVLVDRKSKMKVLEASRGRKKRDDISMLCEASIVPNLSERNSWKLNNSWPLSQHSSEFREIIHSIILLSK